MVRDIQKAPWLIVALLLVVVVFPPAQELSIAEMFPPGPDLPVQEGDYETREITTYEARQALWYVQMYGLARETLIEKDALLAEQETLTANALDVASTQRSRKIFWRRLTFGGTLAGITFGLFLGALATQ